MSTTKAAGDVPQVPADPVPPAQTPTITHYQQIAANLAKAIDDMLVLIPSFAEAHPDTTTFVNRHQNVPLQFIATAAAAVEANPELQGGYLRCHRGPRCAAVHRRLPPDGGPAVRGGKESHVQHQLPEGKRRDWSVGGLCHRQACGPQSTEHDRGVARRKPQTRPGKTRPQEGDEAGSGHSRSGTGTGHARSAPHFHYPHGGRHRRAHRRRAGMTALARGHAVTLTLS